MLRASNNLMQHYQILFEEMAAIFPWPNPGTSSFLHQIIPSASQGISDPLGRGNENIDLPGLNPLDVADIQVHLFGQFFLGNIPRAALTADVLAELLDKFLHWERHNGAFFATD
jgi:hypothetical protein